MEGCQESGDGDDGPAAEKAATALGRRLLREVQDAAVQVGGKRSGCALAFFCVWACWSVTPNTECSTLAFVCMVGARSESS